MTTASGLRLLTWNVRDLLDDATAVAEVLRAAAPDVACLQEFPRWPGSRWRLAGLARSAGLFAVAGGRAAAGAAILASARCAMSDVAAERLPVDGWFTRPRGLVIGTARLPGRVPVRVLSIHLGLDPAERARHVSLVLERCRAAVAAGLPVVVAGDLNERPDGPSWTSLAEVVQDPAPGAPPTFPAAAPQHRIDAVLVGPRVSPPAATGAVRVVEYVGRPPDADLVRRASDHLPVLAVLDLPPA